MHDLSLYVLVGKTGSSTMRALLLHAAVASPNPAWLCTPGMPHGNADCARAEVALGAERRDGSGDVSRAATGWQRGRRFFTTLREPVERAASEYAYFCLWCGDENKFCGRMARTDCVHRNVTFAQWLVRAPNQYTRRFARFWPGLSYSQSYVRGFPELAPVTRGDLDRAVATLTRPSSLVVYLDEMNTSDLAVQRAALDRLRAWLGGGNGSHAARALADVATFPHENALPSELRYVPTAAERRLACSVNDMDCALYARLRPNRSCAC